MRRFVRCLLFFLVVMVSQRKVGSFEMSGPLPQQSPSSPLRAGGGGGMHVGSGGGMGGEEGHLLDLPLGSSSNHNHHHHKRSLRSSPRSLRHVLQVVRTGSSRLFAKNNNHDNKPEMDWDTPQIDWKRAGQQLGLFQQMSIPYYQESIRARWLLVGLLVLTFFNSGVSVLFSYVGKDFWNALAAKDAEQFYTVLVRYVGALAVGAPVATLYYYQREQLAVHWREWMTARTFDLYRSNQVYYKLERDRLSIDNPDQRITEDVKSFTSFSLSLLITMITSVIDLCSFSLILWSIYPQLFGAIILYAAAGTVVTTVLGKKLVRLNFQQLRREADLRYALVRLRDNAESIAFYAGEDLEGQAVETRLEGVMDNRRNINVAQRNVEFFTNAYRYMVQILPVAVVAPQYFAGKIELGVISQSVGAFNHILMDLSIIINQFEDLSTFSAGIERLSSFYEAMRDVDAQRNSTAPLLQVASIVPPVTAMGLWRPDQSLTPAVDDGLPPPHTLDTSSRSTVSYGDSSHGGLDGSGRHDSSIRPYGEINLQRWQRSPGNHTVLQIHNMDLATPDHKRILIRNLNVSLQYGEHLLIVGNSGAGKSSLLRAIAGLWTVGNGMIGRPADDDVYFLPQRPYCTVGTLKDQLLYPSLDYSEGDNMDLSTGKNGRNGEDVGNKILPRSHWLKQALSGKDLLQILEKVDLLDVAVRAGDGDPAKGLSAVMDWSNMLSLGEQQRLAFGRLLVNRPKLVIVDEATSALDLANEARMYMLLQEMAQTIDTHDGSEQLPGLTYISVGHRPSLVAFHDKKLRLGGDQADHELSEIEKSTQEQRVTPSNM